MGGKKVMGKEQGKGKLRNVKVRNVDKGEESLKRKRKRQPRKGTETIITTGKIQHFPLAFLKRSNMHQNIRRQETFSDRSREQKETKIRLKRKEKRKETLTAL